MTNKPIRNYRQINTRVWSDSWFCELETDEKLAFIYLFSNESTSISGMYELPIRKIAFDVGLSTARAKEIMQLFVDAGKIMYQDGVVWIKNFFKYQSVAGRAIIGAANDIQAINDDNPVRVAYMAQCDFIDKLPAPVLPASKPNKNGKTPAIDFSGEAFRAYESNIGMLTPMVAQSIADAIEDYSSEWVVQAIKVATQMEKRSWKYVEGVLRGYKRDGFNTERKKDVQDNGLPAGIVYGGS